MIFSNFFATELTLTEMVLWPEMAFWLKLVLWTRNDFWARNGFSAEMAFWPKILLSSESALLLKVLKDLARL